MEKFDILFDKTAVTITTIVIVILLISILSVFFFFKKSDHKIVLIISSLSILLPLIITSFFIPTSYSISKENIVIQKVVGKITINKDDVKDVSVIHRQDLKGMYRTFASGGFGGYFGKYSSSKHDVIYVYAGTLSQNLVMIELKDNTLYLITPKEIDRFLEKMDICRND